MLSWDRGLSSGEPVSELGGVVSGELLAQESAFHDPGVVVPGLRGETVECVLGRAWGALWSMDDRDGPVEQVWSIASASFRNSCDKVP